MVYIISTSLVAILSISITLSLVIHWILFFRAQIKRKRSEFTYPTGNYSAVLVVSNEQNIIKDVVENLIRQKNISLTEIIVVINNSQDQTHSIIKSLSLSSEINIKIFEIPYFTGKSSALIRGLKAVTNKMVFLLDADIILYPDSFSRLATFSENHKSDFTVGIIKYKEENNFQSKIIEIERYFINSFLQVARGSLGVATIHGSLSLVNIERYLSFLKERILQEDLLVTYELIRGDMRINILNEVIAEEADKSKFLLLILQRIRWTIGNIKIIPQFISALIKTRSVKNKVLLVSYPLLWYFIYYSICLGYLLGVFNHILLGLNLIVHMIYFLITTYMYTKDKGFNFTNIIICFLHALIFPLLITVSGILAIFSIIFKINIYSRLFFRRF